MAATKVETKVIADTKHWEVHMKTAAKAADNTRKASARLDRQNSALVKSFSKAASAASVLHGPLNGISGRLTAMATALRQTRAGWVAFGAAITGASALIVASIRSYAEFEVQMKRVAAVQEATGNASGVTGRQIHDMAQQIAADTLASVDGVMAAAAALGTFDTVSGEAFERTLRLSQDVAEVMGVDIKSATVQMGKALADPLAGLSALSRQGVTFSETVKEQIAVAVEFGDVMKAQGLILDTVESQLGGVAEAVSADTLVGAWDLLTQRVQTFMRTATGASTASKLLASGLNFLSGAINGITLTPAEQLVDALEEIAKAEQRVVNHTKAPGLFSEGRYEKQLLEAKQYYAKLLVIAKQQRDADAAAAKAGAEKSAAVVAEARIAAAEKNAKKYAAAEARIQKQLADARKSLASGQRDELGTGNEPNIDSRADRLKTAEEARYAAVSAAAKKNQLKMQQDMALHHQKRAELDKQYKELAVIREKEHVQNIANIQEDADKSLAEAYNRAWSMAEEQSQRRETLFKESIAGWSNLASQIGSVFSGLASAFEQGSKAQKAAAVLSQGAAFAEASANIAVAMSGAMKSSAHPAAMAAAVAQTVALGTQVFAMLAKSRRGGRAMGGSVDAGGTYWVGERGPELVHMNRPGHVTKADDVGGNVSIQLIEDASKAGQQTTTPDGIIQVAVASIMGTLQQDLQLGRGIFRQAENQYASLRR